MIAEFSFLRLAFGSVLFFRFFFVVRAYFTRVCVCVCVEENKKSKQHRMLLICLEIFIEIYDDVYKQFIYHEKLCIVDKKNK